MDKIKLAKALKNMGGKDLTGEVLSTKLREEMNRKIEEMRRAIPNPVDLTPLLKAHADLTKAVESLNATSREQNKDIDIELSLLRSKLLSISDALNNGAYATPQDLRDLRVTLLGLIANTGGGNANRNIVVDSTTVLSPYTDINLKSGTNVTLSASTNNTTKQTDITFSATGGGGGYQAATGTVDGSNTIFTFSTAPNVICVDQGRVMQQTSSDGTVNWTGTTTVTLAIAPNFDIFGVC